MFINSKNLALLGGEKLIDYNFKAYNSLGDEEVVAASKVVKTGILSNFYGSASDKFFGGENVLAFEKACTEYFQVKHAITVNSWTSGLICAVGSLNIEPGDEIITTPWTMCATATAILHWNAIPVFADIDPLTFNIDPLSIEKNISSHTKAILAVDIFGQSCDINKINEIARKNNLKVITDSAQSIGALNSTKYAGTLSDIGGYSLNCHKHIQTGEGGIILTNDNNLARRLQLIRNHGEAVEKSKKIENFANILGYNFRLGEIECAIGIEQLKKLDKLIISRQKVAEKLNKELSGLNGLSIPYITPNNTHSYYVYALTLDIEKTGVSRDVIFSALTAEGLQGLYPGYNLLYNLPIYKNKIAYGSNGFPWNNQICKREINYNDGICKIAEKMHNESFLGIGLCVFEFNERDLNNLINVFYKVWDNLDTLKNIYSK